MNKKKQPKHLCPKPGNVASEEETDPPAPTVPPGGDDPPAPQGRKAQ